MPILTTALVTAYCSCFICTDKLPDHPFYHITSVRTYATEGRTVACDSKYRWQVVYIETVGWRVCEDVGGAINGSDIDLYFESHKVASKFKKLLRVFGPIKNERILKEAFANEIRSEMNSHPVALFPELAVDFRGTKDVSDIEIERIKHRESITNPARSNSSRFRGPINYDYRFRNVDRISGGDRNPK